MDEGSQIAAELTGVTPGEVVIDFCAGAGGKTVAMGGIMKNDGQVVMCDVNESRLRRGIPRVKQAMLRNVDGPVCLSSQKQAVEMDGAVGMADCVLADVPCTGSGTWRRNPVAMHNFRTGDLEKLNRS